MLTFKIIQTSFNSTRRPPLIPFITPATFNTKHSLITWPCRSSKPRDSEDSESSPVGGDPRQQEILAQIVMLETEKVRLTDYLDDQAACLTQFVQEAKVEIDAIGENALRDLDRASARIMESMDSKMQAYEESSRKNRQEIAKRDKEIADFESEYENLKNEGMFFKSLGLQRTPSDPKVKAAAREEAKKIKEFTREINATSNTRKNIYLAFVWILAAGVADSLVSDSPDWRKTAVLSTILVSVLAQFAYEQRILPEMESKALDKKKNDEEK